ncbi:MAG TPA: hypothetical protein DCP69_07905 [Candidatus Omnitrophica bacterium]|nr:hypothetical protein [Candidatus Omnitrophota bacterium]
MWQRQLVIELKEAKSRERKTVLERYQGMYGYSKEHLYRIAREFGFVSGRKEREDKGLSVLAEEQIDFVAAFINKSARENKGSFMPVENAMEIAIDNNILQRGEISVGGMGRILRDRQMDAKRQNAPTPHTEMRSLHPNHVHLVDSSVCIQYYLADGGLKIMREDEFYKNKFENFKKVKEPLQRYVLTDHFSSSLFVKYYVAAGETAENLFDFLVCAWEAKQDERFPFRGAPLKMLMDGGCHAKARAMGAGFWDGLDIDIIPGKTGNSRRQGAVEVHHNIWEMWFETRLRFDPASTVEELNLKARDFCIWFNATRKHTRTQMTRLSCWMLIKSEQLRELPERAVLQDLMNKPEETRTVTNHMISYEGKSFNLKFANIPHGSKVKVIKNIWKWKDSIITVSYDNNLFDVQSVEKLPAELGGFSAHAAIIGEEYKAQPHTVTQQGMKRAEELAYANVLTPEMKPEEKAKAIKKATPFAGMNVFGGFADKLGNMAALPKQGTVIEMGREIVSRSIPITEFFKRLRDEVGRIAPDMNRELRAIYGEAIDAAEAAQVIEQIASGTWAAGCDTRQAQNL